MTRGTFQNVEPRCKVCTSPDRREIDMLLATGWSQANVITHFNNIKGEDYYKRDGMSTHARKHLSARDAGVVKIYEERARQEGVDTELYSGFILTKQGVAENVILSGLEALQRGDTTVEPKDILKAIEVLTKLKQDQAGVAEEELKKEARAFMLAVQQNVPQDMWANIYADYEIKLGRKPLPILPEKVESEEIVNEGE